MRPELRCPRRAELEVLWVLRLRPRDVSQERAFAAALFGLLLVVAGVLRHERSRARPTEDDPYRISGNVQLDGEPLEGVALTVDGPGGQQEVETDENGQWRVGVPERGETTSSRSTKTTLPRGHRGGRSRGRHPERQGSRDGPGRARDASTSSSAKASATSRASSISSCSGVVQGLSFGLMLGLAAIGLSLVFGTTGISNFAHGEMVTFGAIAAFAARRPGDSRTPAVARLSRSPSSSAPCLGLLLDMILWRPLRRRRVGRRPAHDRQHRPLAGAALHLPALHRRWHAAASGFVPRRKIPLFGAVADERHRRGLARRSRSSSSWGSRCGSPDPGIGKATRAISDNASLAAASGIDVDAVVRVVWIVAGSARRPRRHPVRVLPSRASSGTWARRSCCSCSPPSRSAVSAPRTAPSIGSLIVGILVEVSSLWIPADLKYASALFILIVILLFRPQGILGRRERIG